MNDINIGIQWSTSVVVLAHKALSPKIRLHWIYLLSALLMALWTYRRSRRQGEQGTLAQYLFPRSVWLHSSAITDYAFFALTVPIWTLFVLPRLPAAAQYADHLRATAQHWFGAGAGLPMKIPAIALLYGAVLVVVGDFARYWVHRLMHGNQALWEFHKVHHSAEVLTPITFYRTHPVDMLVQALVEPMAIAFVTALFAYLFPGVLSPYTFLGVNIFRFTFYLLGANLRHSHIWLSFGSNVEHVLISPAQHQIHHSADPKHFGRNFGSEFAIWDWLFGTLQCAGQERPVVLGLGTDENAKLSTVWQLYARPFQASWPSSLSP